MPGAVGRLVLSAVCLLFVRCLCFLLLLIYSFVGASAAPRCSVLGISRSAIANRTDEFSESLLFRV